MRRFRWTSAALFAQLLVSSLVSVGHADVEGVTFERQIAPILEASACGVMETRRSRPVSICAVGPQSLKVAIGSSGGRRRRQEKPASRAY